MWEWYLIIGSVVAVVFSISTVKRHLKGKERMSWYKEAVAHQGKKGHSYGGQK